MQCLTTARCEQSVNNQTIPWQIQHTRIAEGVVCQFRLFSFYRFIQFSVKMILRSVLTLLAAVAVANGLSLSDQAMGRRAFVGAMGAASLALGPGAGIAADTTMPTAGAKAPDFELPNSRGNGLTSLDTLTQTGKWTVLYFYPGAFTSGCTLEARGFQRDLEDYRKLNTQIVGVSVDPVEKNAQFCTEEKLDFYMLSDRGGLVSKKYGSALSIPGFGTFSNRQTYIIDPRGELRGLRVSGRLRDHGDQGLGNVRPRRPQRRRHGDR